MLANAKPEVDPVTLIDRDLLDRAIRNEATAWKLLFAYFTPKFQVLAVRLFVKYGRSYGFEAHPQFVADLVQEAWVQIAKNCQQIALAFDPDKGSVPAIIMKVAQNRMVDYLRSSSRNWKREIDIEEQGELAESRLDPESLLANEKDCADLWAFIEQELSHQERELIRRVFIDDENILTIAQEQKLERNTLDKRLSRARQRLRDWMSNRRRA